MGNFEVLAQEFEGEADERLVLGVLEGGIANKETVLRTSRRCESGLSFEVMWSAILLPVEVHTAICPCEITRRLLMNGSLGMQSPGEMRSE